jgi:putative glutamine amidotransferase
MSAGATSVSQHPIIGIPTQTMNAIPHEVPDCWVVGQCYVKALVAAGAVPWLLPLLPGDTEMLRRMYDKLDGVFLTGGADVDPSQYGEKRRPLCGRSDQARDWVETNLIRWAVANHKPVFGVCRGTQAINVALGGTLHQDVADQRPSAIRHDCFAPAEGYQRDSLVHEVNLEKGSLLRRIMEVERVLVNSLHHQAIKVLAPGLTATAFAPDGLIEGVEGEGDQFLVGVQWHPEELAEAHEPHRRLFHAFVQACAKSGAHTHDRT